MARLKTTLSGRDAARERAEEEARFHVEMKTEELVGRGMDRKEAKEMARKSYGPVLRQQEEASDADLVRGVEGWLRDFAVSWRRLRRSPLFLLSSVLLLALGLGVNAAVFSVIDRLFLRSLPVPRADRLVVLEEYRNGKVSNSNPVRIADWRERVTSFSAVASNYSETAVLHERETNRAVGTMRVIGDWMGLLGVGVIEGRAFSAEELRGAKVAILTEAGRRIGRVGETIRIGTDAYQVIGITSNVVGMGEGVEVLLPLAPGLQKTSRKAGFVSVVARLKDGVTPQAAESEAMSVATQLGREYPDSDAGMTVRIVGAQKAWTAEARKPAMLAQAGAGLLLLITMVNLAGLMAARAMERQREDRVRVFLGAGRWHLLRLHLVEAGMVVCLGTLAAMIVAPWALQVLQVMYGDDFGAIRISTVDARVAVFLFGVAIVSTLALAAAMAFQSADRSGRFRLRNALVVAEAALGLLLLAAALQMVRDFSELRFAPNGFREQGLLNARVDFPWEGDGFVLRTVVARGMEEIGAMPGVSGVAVVDRLPLEGNSMDGPVFIQGVAEKTRESVGLRMATNSYYELMGIPLLAGELPGDANSVLVNESFAKRYLNGQAVGRSVSQDGKKWLRIAGVLRDVRFSAKAGLARPEIFGSERVFFWPKLNVVIRTSETAAAMAPGLRQSWTGISNFASFQGVRSLEGRIDEIVAMPRRQRDVVSVFGFLALALVVAGVYGIMASEMLRRRREMGIRIAIGATRGNIVGIALARAARLGIAGCVLGGVAVLLLFGSWVHAEALAGAVGAIAGGMILAALLPAWKVARVDPILAIRHD